MKCLDPTPDAPAAVAAEHVQGHFRDATAVMDFVKSEWACREEAAAARRWAYGLMRAPAGVSTRETGGG
jgi:hypothetical protein